MTAASPQRPARKNPSPEDSRLLWLLVIAAWLALAAWAIMTFREHLPSHGRRLSPLAAGEYHEVRDFVPPLALRLDNGRVVRPAGVAVPGEAGPADRAAARLRELAPPGAVVYVELEPRLPGAESATLPASLWLPPPDSGRPEPFPYEQSRLIGAVLVQEGLVAVDPDEPYMYQNEFRMLEDDARRHHRGLWADE